MSTHDALQAAADWLMSQGHTIAARALDEYIETGAGGTATEPAAEEANEVEKLRTALHDAADQIAVLESDLGAATARVAELEAAAARVAKFCAARAEYVRNARDYHPGGDADYWRWNGHAEARRQLSQLLDLPVAWPAEVKPAPVPLQRGEAR